MNGLECSLSIDLPGFGVLSIDAASGDRLDVAVAAGMLEWVHWGTGGEFRNGGSVPQDPAILERQSAIDGLFKGLGFARPGKASDHPVMK